MKVVLFKMSILPGAILFSPLPEASLPAPIRYILHTNQQLDWEGFVVFRPYICFSDHIFIALSGPRHHGSVGSLSSTCFLQRRRKRHFHTAGGWLSGDSVSVCCSSALLFPISFCSWQFFYFFFFSVRFLSLPLPLNKIDLG